MSEDPDRDVQPEFTVDHVLDRLLGTGAVIGSADQRVQPQDENHAAAVSLHVMHY